MLRHELDEVGVFVNGQVSCIFVVALLDIVVAGAWYALFKPVNRRLSATAAWVISLGLFGIYLVLIGYLAFRSGFMAKTVR
ncbi:hypothetical protein [Pseudarthrobacter sp. H2]|uniref:hypothetical protein n=1 Tax=Pseudarthrobacter sp. H2 TaxID=3418415 RepID=UPI003CF3DFA8